MSHPRVLLSCLLLATFSLSVWAARWTPDPTLGNSDQHRRLYDIARTYCDANFDPDANLVGTASKNPPNKKSHSVRESLSYAYALLLTGDPADLAVAQKVIKRALIAQDTRPDSPTCGVFSWYAEDDWATLKNADQNSAAFDGLTCAMIFDLDKQHPVLDADVRSQVEAAGKLAVAAVMRRDVEPGYTNIALLSIALGAAGEKLWSVPGAGAFAEAKLDKVTSMAGDQEFYEYLSPTYLGVDIYGAYSARKFSFSPAFATKADALIDHLWKEVAASYHAPTFQLAGPFCRAYGDNMLAYAAALKYDLFLALDGAYPLPDTETDHDWDKAGLAVIANLPILPRSEFKQPTVPWREFTATGTDEKSPVRHFSQYREGNFILGTVAYQDEWKQKRNLVAYWRNDGPPPDGYSVGYCIDESNETLSSKAPAGFIHFYSQQVKGAALVAMATNRDVPLDGGCSLVFDGSAKVSDGIDAGSLKVDDGTVTAYVYPVSNGAGSFVLKADANNVRLNRPWTQADAVTTTGPLHVVSYLIVFRLSGQLAPTISDLVLKGDENGASATAKVDGDALSVSFKN